ncbi:MAG: ribbon-helix-helix protein, CopG family [Desulfosalsimonadaceae bacterium]|nr:ribbon-helix-helix protein, CopG family [Desulfosalsimonadaceae bacterium]
MITLRLDHKLEQHIQNTAKMLGVTKSDLIRKSITEYLAKLNTPTPWELGESVFGRYASGQDNLSTDRKSLIKIKIQAKRK